MVENSHQMNSRHSLGKMGLRDSAPEGTYRERKKPKTYSNCMALLSDIIDTEPTCYEKAIENKEWKDVMIEEYESILKNYVWDVVPVDYYSCMRHPPGHKLIEMT
jgi:hypothetical protein